MQVYKEIDSFRKARKQLPKDSSLGFVATMGALHQGHASLAKQSVQDNAFTVVSIFVNPTQFGEEKDLSSYPKTLTKDCELLESLGVDIVFAPDPAQIYGDTPSQIIFSLRDLDKSLCGQSREGHFNGVVQVVSILFNIVQPQHAYFGLKDFQQYLIISKMAKEMHFPVEVVGCPTVREEDGVAMSSRNMRLTSEERKQAVVLIQSLKAVQKEWNCFENIWEIKTFVQAEVSKCSLARLDYFEILNEENLSPVQTLSLSENPHAFMAVVFDNARLIDNLKI